MIRNIKIKKSDKTYIVSIQKLNTIGTALSFVNEMTNIKSTSWSGFKLISADKNFKPTVKELISVINQIKNDDNYFVNIHDKLVSFVPDVSLSKYQKYLPDSLRKKMNADYVYDITGAAEFIKNI